MTGSRSEEDATQYRPPAETAATPEHRSDSKLSMLFVNSLANNDIADGAVPRTVTDVGVYPALKFKPMDFHKYVKSLNNRHIALIQRIFIRKTSIRRAL